MRFYLVRHASSTLAGSGRWQGWRDVGLSARGIAEVETARMAAFLPSLPFVFASSLRRCVETASLLFPTSIVLADDRLRTRKLGIWEGLLTAEIERDGGGWFTPFATDRPPGGESLGEVTTRVWAFLDDVAMLGAPEGAAVTHGAVIGMVMQLLGDAPKIIKPCSAVVLTRAEGAWRVLSVPPESVPPV